MKIYEWSDAEDGAEYVGKTENDDRRITWNDKLIGEPLPDIADWPPPILTQYLGESGKRKPRPTPDSVGVISGNLISPRAAEALRDIWDRHALLYPVILDDVPEIEYYMVVVTTVLDCLDREKSKGPLQTIGPTPDLFANLHTWVFDENCVGDTDVFTIPDNRTIIFVTERFKSRVVEAGLKRFCLKKEYWDSDPWVS